MSLQTQYNKFSKKIALTRESKEYKKARERDDNITPKVEKALEEEGYEVDSNFLQGSLKSHTGVTPVDDDYDIDRAIALKFLTSPGDPVKAKKIVKDVLLKHGFTDVKIKKPCVTANYKSDNAHIDFPIYRKTLFGNFQLGVGKEHSDDSLKNWEDSDPKGLVEWVTSDKNHQSFLGLGSLSTEEKSQFYRIVRYLKRWRDNTYNVESERKKVYSIALTIMAKESFSPVIDDDTGKVDDHSALKQTVNKILEGHYFTEEEEDKFVVCVNLPVTPNNNIYSESGKSVGSKFRRRLKRFKDNLQKVDELGSLTDQCELLRKQFGNDFPIPDSDPESRASVDSPGIVGISNGAVH